MLLVLLMGACSGRQMPRYSQFGEVDPQGWRREQALAFDVPQQAAPNLEICVRHTGSFPYKELYLRVELFGSGGDIYADTLCVPMADDAGRWLGKGSFGLYTLREPLGVKLPADSLVHVEITQVLSDDSPVGIRNIGLISE